MAWIRCTGNTGGSLKVRTASGAIATFETNMVDVLQEVKCEINAKQDLHGEDKPYPAGGGVNLFDKTNVFEGYIIDTNGNFSSRTGDASTDFISVVGGASYYVKSEQDQGMWGAWYNENKEFISACTGYANSVITAPTNAKFVRLTVVHNSGNVDTFSFNYPATDTQYHPYENVCPIIGIDELNISRTGVNLWDEEWELGTINDSTGELTPMNDRIRSKNFIPVKNGQTYYFTSTYLHKVIYYDKNQNFVSGGDTAWDTKQTYELPNNVYYIKFAMAGAYGTTYHNDISINYPATDTLYHPYNGQTYTIAFGQTVYGGVPDVTRGKLRVTHGFVDLGDLTWSLSSSLFRATVSGIKNPTTNPERTEGIISDIYVADTTGLIDKKYMADNSMLHDWDTIFIKNTAYNDANVFKTAMEGHELVYELATPFDIDLTPEVISAVVGTNNVFADCGQTEVKYLKRE